MALHMLVVAGDSHQRDRLQWMLARAFPFAIVIVIASGYNTLMAYQSGPINVLNLAQDLPDIRGNTLLHYLLAAGVTTPTILVAERFLYDTLITETDTYVVPKPIQFMDVVGMITYALTATYHPTLTA